MKLIIAGSRHLDVNSIAFTIIVSFLHLSKVVKEVISGDARGVDSIGAYIAEDYF